MISTLENHIWVTSSKRTKRSDSSWTNLPTRLLWRRPNFKNRQPERNSMSLPRIFIILLRPKLFLEYITHLIHNWNLKHLMSILRRTSKVHSKQTIAGNQPPKKKWIFSENWQKSRSEAKRTWNWQLDEVG